MTSKAYLLNLTHFWVTEDQIDDWFHQMNCFFVLAHGRSGTAFVADLLNNSSYAYVVHEPILDDYKAYQLAYHNERKGLDYFSSFRMKDIYIRVRKKKVTVYGEVNSLLRRHVSAIRAKISEASLFHLVRDGRDVVRSMWSRKTMTPIDPHTNWLSPPRDDPYHSEWGNMDRFSKLCWYWQSENEYLRKKIQNRVQFEKLITDYQYFKCYLAEKISLDIPQTVWERKVNLPKNETQQHKLPHWSNWNQFQKDTFLRICGNEMIYSGYENVEHWDNP